MNLQSFLQSSSQSESLQSVILSLAEGVKAIQANITPCSTGKAGEANASGDEQMALDVLSNQLLEEALKKNNNIYAYASEEEEDMVIINESGKYSVAFDPLDGSSLINTNLAIGTIFGIYESKGFLGQKGRNQVCAGYAVYGPRTTLVIGFKSQLVSFTLDNKGDFQLTQKDISIKENSKYFAPGNLRASSENPKYLELVNLWMQAEKTLRYSGGMVPDINIIFCKGEGIFAYPGYSKYPNGKLRLLYECAPFAFLAEAASGIALDQNGKNILDLGITELHQRSTIFIGSKKEVERAVEILK